MRVFRIYNEGRLPDDAFGSSIAGGRWNPPGIAVLYTSAHLSLACLEKLVHLERGTMPRQLRYAWAEISSEPSSLSQSQEHLHLGLNYSTRLGERWLESAGELAVRVPSVLIPDEDNVLINPAHSEYSSLQWNTFPFDWDKRMLELIHGVR